MSEFFNDDINTTGDNTDNAGEEVNVSEPVTETEKEEKLSVDESETVSDTEEVKAEMFTEEGTVETPALETVNAAEISTGRKNKKKEKKAKKPSFFGKILAAAAIGLAFGIFAAGGFYGVNQLIASKMAVEDTATDTNSEVEELKKQIDSLKNAVQLNNAGSTQGATLLYADTGVSSIVEKVMPSMVSVTNIYESVTNFWGRQFVDEKEASGSGIIIGENNTEYLIATNYHVIEAAKQLSVQFVDSTSAEAYVKGYDSSMDIALIAVSKDNLEKSTQGAITVAELGDSDSLKMGETAIAIGNALGYGQSVTTGVISALDREIDIEKSVSDLIQTSAAINPGNSGGALLNSKGQVIGINSSKIGSTTVEGMGFAIPINEVKDILFEFSSREIKDKVAEADRGYLGISGLSVSNTGLTSLGFPDGAYIDKVYEGSAAEQAGIYSGDIVTKVNGQSVDSIEGLQEALSYFREGETVKITLVRRVDGSISEITVDVTLGSRNTIPTE